MTITPPINPFQGAATTPATGSASSAAPGESDPTSLRFEQLLWAELLTHTGLEKALTLGGGDGAAMFSRYFVEAIAADIAEQHPLGLLSDTMPVTEAPNGASDSQETET